MDRTIRKYRYDDWTEVAPGLIVGSLPHVPHAVWTSLDVKAVINLTEVNQSDYLAITPPLGSVYLRVPILEGPLDLQDPGVMSAVLLCRELLFVGQRVLVHCREGIIRSVAFAGYVVGAPEEVALKRLNSVADKYERERRWDLQQEAQARQREGVMQRG